MYSYSGRVFKIFISSFAARNEHGRTGFAFQNELPILPSRCLIMWDWQSDAVAMFGHRGAADRFLLLGRLGRPKRSPGDQTFRKNCSDRSCSLIDRARFATVTGVFLLNRSWKFVFFFFYKLMHHNQSNRRLQKNILNSCVPWRASRSGFSCVNFRVHSQLVFVLFYLFFANFV